MELYFYPIKLVLRIALYPILVPLSWMLLPYRAPFFSMLSTGARFQPVLRKEKAYVKGSNAYIWVPGNAECGQFEYNRNFKTHTYIRYADYPYVHSANLCMGLFSLHHAATELKTTFEDLISKEYKIYTEGFSMGGATLILATSMLREKHGEGYINKHFKKLRVHNTFRNLNDVAASIANEILAPWLKGPMFIDIPKLVISMSLLVILLQIALIIPQIFLGVTSLSFTLQQIFLCSLAIVAALRLKTPKDSNNRENRESPSTILYWCQVLLTYGILLAYSIVYPPALLCFIIVHSERAKYYTFYSLLWILGSHQDIFAATKKLDFADTPLQINQLIGDTAIQSKTLISPSRVAAEITHIKCELYDKGAHFDCKDVPTNPILSF